jgi:hypothetical protein
MSDNGSQIFAVGGRRPRGRPRSTVTKERRTLYVPTTYLERLDALAARHGISRNRAFCAVLDLALRVPVPAAPSASIRKA